MAHQRTQIRQAIVSAVTGLATSADRVYVQQINRLDKSTGPGIIVRMTEAELQADRGSMGRVLEWELTVEFVCFQYGTIEATVEETLDNMAGEIEGALAADPTLGGVCEDIAPSSAVYQFDNEQEKISGTLTVTYSCQYRHEYGQPETPEV